MVEWLMLLLILGAVVVVILMTTIVQIEQYESGVALRLGKYHSMLNPGWNFVVPLITQVFKVDLRIQVLDVPRQEVITKDNSPTMVDAVVYYKVADAKKAVLAVANYRAAIVNMAQTTLRGVVGDMELDEIFSSRDKINAILREKLDIETDPWGVKVDNVEIREVDPSPNVKAAMEEQTSAERERRAAILKADGEKRSAILSAEGEKQSRILTAEGDKQSRILAAEGVRQSIVLEAQEQEIPIEEKPLVLTNEVEEKTEANENLSPAVRKIVAENKIDVKKIKGSGKEGRILKEDLIGLM